MIEGVTLSENYTLAKTMMDVSVVKHRALASNMANIQTPGYKRVQLNSDFESKLAQAVEQKDFKKLISMRPELERDTVSTSVRADGNNVSLEDELLLMNQNSLNYQFLTQYMTGAVSHLKTAVTGRVM